MRPSTNSITQRQTISLTGGKTLGLTSAPRLTSSQAASTSATGAILMSKGMPGHRAPQPYEIETVEEVAEGAEPDHHGQHGIVGAYTAVRKDEIAEAGLGGDEFGAHQHDDGDGNRGTHAGGDLRQRRRQHDAPEEAMLRSAARAGGPEEHVVDTARTVEARHDHRQQAGERDDRDLGDIADAEPDHEERDERGLGHRVDEEQHRLDRALHRFHAGHHDPERNSADHGDREPGPGAGKGGSSVAEDLARAYERAERRRDFPEGRQHGFRQPAGARGRLPGGDDDEEWQQPHVRTAATSSFTLRQMRSLSSVKAG